MAFGKKRDNVLSGFRKVNTGLDQVQSGFQKAKGFGRKILDKTKEALDYIHDKYQKEISQPLKTADTLLGGIPGELFKATPLYPVVNEAGSLFNRIRDGVGLVQKFF